VHNGLDFAIQVSGFPDGEITVPPGEFVRVAGIRRGLDLTATKQSGDTAAERNVPLTPPGGESVWAVGGKACFALGDFSPYYGEETILVGIQLEALMTLGQEFMAVDQRVAAGPGRRLPANHRGGKVLGLVQIPCDAATTAGVARGWLELILPEIEPKT
jgi:hypothetical protein